MTAPDTKTPEATPEQQAAIADASAAMAKLETRLREVREATLYDLEAVKPPLAYASEKLAEIQEQLHQVRQLPDSPDKDYAVKALVIQQRLFEGNGQMIEAQVACDRRNLEVLDKALELIGACQGNIVGWVQLQEQGILGDALPFAEHEQDLAYQIGRAQMNLFLGLHLWLASVDGIDGLLRATDNGEAIEPRDAEEKAGRERIAAEIKAAMDADPEAAKAIGSLGADLAEAFTYLEWGAPLLKAIKAMPPEAQAKRLADPDWKKLAGQVQILAGLIPKVQAWPAVARFFHAPREQALPFTLPPWKG